MDMRQAFPSNYISAGDLAGNETQLVIAGVSREAVGQNKDMLPVMTFQGAQKGFVLNKTNTDTIMGMYGADSEAWLGKILVLYPSETPYQGKMVPCVRVKSPALGAGTVTAGDAAMNAIPPQDDGIPPADMDDSIPF